MKIDIKSINPPSRLRLLPTLLRLRRTGWRDCYTQFLLAAIILTAGFNAIAMEQPPQGSHAEGFAEGTESASFAVGYQPPINSAAEDGNSLMVEMLLEDGADVNSKGYGKSALACAAGKGHKGLNYY